MNGIKNGWKSISIKLLPPAQELQYEGIYQRHIQPDFGRMKLKDIQPLQIRGKLVKLDKQGFGYETQNKVVFYCWICLTRQCWIM